MWMDERTVTMLGDKREQKPGDQRRKRKRIREINEDVRSESIRLIKEEAMLIIDTSLWKYVFFLAILWFHRHQDWSVIKFLSMHSWAIGLFTLPLSISAVSIRFYACIPLSYVIHSATYVFYDLLVSVNVWDSYLYFAWLHLFQELF